MRAIILLIAFISSVGMASANDDVLINTFRFNPVQGPQSLGDVLNDCMNNEACSSALEAAAAYVGADPSTVASVGQLASTRRTSGEETRQVVDSYPGYAICRVSTRVISINPQSGDRSAHYHISAAPDRVQFYAWVPQGGFLEGRRWIDAEVRIVMIKQALFEAARANGTCSTNPAGLVHLTCRGAGSGAHGFPGCPGSTVELAQLCPTNLCRRIEP